MGWISPLKPRQVAALLSVWGFEIIRQRGSHQQWRHLDGRCTTLSVHPGRDISPMMIRKIAKDIGLGVEQFLAGSNSGRA